MVGADTYALGLGQIEVQTGLGQQLRARVEVHGYASQNADLSCYKATIESPDGDLLSTATIEWQHKDGLSWLILHSKKKIQEPAVKLVLSVTCDTQLRREYLALLDPTLPNVQSEETPIVAPLARPNDALVAVPIKRQRGDKALPQSRTENRPAPKPEKSLDRPSRTAPKVEREVKDSLQLSDSPALVAQGLKMSESLGEPRTQAVRSDIEELRLAQAQFAAMLRGEDATSVPASSEKSSADLQKVQSLQNEAQYLKRQVQQGKVMLEELKEASLPKTWAYILSALLLGGVAIIALLLAYIQRMQRKNSTGWWEQKESKPVSSEQKKNIEDLVNSIQATYGTTTTTNEFNTQTVERAIAASTVRNTMPVQLRSETEAPAGNLGKLDAPSIFSRNFSPTLEDTNSSTFNFFSSRSSSVNVEEISDVTQEAEFWMSVNDPERAIEILEHQSTEEHPESPVPWLYLLDLYRLVSNKEKYDDLRDRFSAYFNAHIPEYEVDPATLDTRHLDDFEHLIKKICKAWNTNDALPFLQSLLVDDRDGKRVGFELPVYRDILLLISIAHEIERLNAFDAQTGGGWEKAPDANQAEASTGDLTENSNAIDFEIIDFRNKP